jgi:hypothetical protein
MGFIRLARSIVVGTCAFTVAIAVIRPSQTLAQPVSIKIGPDQSKASKAETFGWLRQRVPELGSFKTDVYDTVTTHAPGTTWPPLTITFLTTLHQDRFDFKWVAVNGCEVQYEVNGGNTDYYRFKIPLQEIGSDFLCCVSCRGEASTASPDLEPPILRWGRPHTYLFQT